MTNSFFVAMLANEAKSIVLITGNNIASLHLHAQKEGLRILQVVENLTQERAALEMEKIAQMLTENQAERTVH